MSHDKIRAAARKRMAETGEPYAAARRAVVTGHQAAGTHIPPSDAGYVLRMSGEIHDWLADLRGSDPPAAIRVGQALAALMSEGASLGAPLVVCPASSQQPADQRETLDKSYQESLERLEIVRRREVDADTLVKDLQDQVAELESAQAKLEDLHRHALDAGRPSEAEQAAGTLAAAKQQMAEARQLLPGVIEARYRLGKATQRLQARVDAFRVRREVLKASYAAAQGSLLAREAIGASGLADDDGDRHQEDCGDAISEARARLRDVTAEIERELAQEIWPEGLMELRPGAAGDSDIRILFAVEPPGTALLIAVLEGLEAVTDQYWEAVMAAADMLQRVKAGQAPEAAACAYDDPRSFLEEFYPGNAGDTGADSSSQ
jgi:hypothetical protein